MLTNWTPRDYAVLLVSFTASLCLLILVLGTMLLVMHGAVTPQLLGAISSVGAGAGLVGLGLVLYLIIQTALNLKSNFDFSRTRFSDPAPWVWIHFALASVTTVLMFWTAVSAPGMFERSAQTEKHLQASQYSLQQEQQLVTWLAWAIQLEHTDTYDTASEFYDKALAMDSNNASLWDLKGYSLFEMKQYEKAISALERSVALNPNVARVYVDLARAYCASGNSEKAQANLHRGLQIDPSPNNAILRGSDLPGQCQ